MTVSDVHVGKQHCVRVDVGRSMVGPKAPQGEPYCTIAVWFGNH